MLILEEAMGRESRLHMKDIKYNSAVTLELSKKRMTLDKLLKVCAKKHFWNKQMVEEEVAYLSIHGNLAIGLNNELYIAAS